MRNPDSEAGPEIIVEILEAVQDQSDPSLKELFGKLLASALDPARSKFYRKQFAGLLNQFEPIDALVLKSISNVINSGPLWVGSVSAQVHRETDEIELSGLNLERLGLIQRGAGATSVRNSAEISPMGRQFLLCTA